MNVVDFLIKYSRAQNGFGMIAILPEFILCNAFEKFPIAFKTGQEPFSSTLRRIIYLGNDSLCRIFLKIPQDL